MKWICLFIAVTQWACSHTPKKSADMGEASATNTKVLAEFERANKLLDENQPEEAAKIYDQLALSGPRPTGELDILVIFNAGVAYFQAENCPVASERFRKVMRMAGPNRSNIRARAMLYMGDVYACLGEDNKAITMLLELTRIKSNLPPENLKAEVPAKLAAAYARIGNNKEATQYFRVAEKGLNQMQGQIRDAVKRKEVLAKTLYVMGNVSQFNSANMTSEDYFATVRSLQKYLFKAVEYNAKQWSPLAVQQIDQAYDRAWGYIERVPREENPDTLLSQRDQQVEKLRVAHIALLGIRELLDERIPDPQEPPIVSQLVEKIKVQERKLTNYVATHVVGTALTPEALQAESIKKAGRALNPDPILEERAMSGKNKVKMIDGAKNKK